jgi:thioredoxin-related protein
MRPSVRRLQEQYQDQIDFHELNVDQSSTIDLARQYQVSGIPLIILLDPQGNLIGRLEGFQDDAMLQAAIDDLLASAN